jgi:predicted nucleic acid-binding Zn ribbon protein
MTNSSTGKKRCPICGAYFVPKHGEKYCSDICRGIGQKQIRRRWEQNTDYLEKQRERMRARYQAEREEAAEVAAVNKAARQKARDAAAQQARVKLEEKAAAGDHFARMILAKQAGDQLTYWREFAAYEIEFAERIGYPSKRTVNGFSVYLPDFAEQVIQNMKEGNILFLRMD